MGLFLYTSALVLFSFHDENFQSNMSHYARTFFQPQVKLSESCFVIQSIDFYIQFITVIFTHTTISIL